VTQTRPRALLFDWDNTLIDSWARVRASARDSFPRLFGDKAPEATEVFYRTFEADHLVNLRAREGAGRMLRGLARENDVYLAVVSNKQGYLLRREAAHLQWEDYFDRLVGATDAPRDKPAPEAVELALEGSGLGPGPEVWLVGDTDIDLLCAVNSGCLPVLLRPAPPGRDEFREAPPKLHVASCEDLLNVVRAL
jgi:phosphoglycolate phosphatase